MAALSADRVTSVRDDKVFGYPVKASTKIYAGALVCLDASGWLVPGSAATTLIAVGVAPSQYDNSAGAGGDITGLAERRVARFDNSTSTDAITKAEIGDDCYIVDDHTVAKTDGSSTRSKAGKIMDVDTLGVWVKVGI